jgi:hypothetical protein
VWYYNPRAKDNPEDTEEVDFMTAPAQLLAVDLGRIKHGVAKRVQLWEHPQVDAKKAQLNVNTCITQGGEEDEEEEEYFDKYGGTPPSLSSCVHLGSLAFIGFLLSII